LSNREKEEELDPKVEKAFAIAIFATVVLGIFISSVSVGNMVGPRYQYQKAVHSHMENAYGASTPELMESQLDLAMQGMRQLGLTEDLYGKLMPWQQTPDWRMDYCYLHIQAIIDRCHEVIDWRNHQDLSSGQVTDIYNQKMNNLRGFIIEGGWSDWIAQNAFYVNYHPFYYVWFGVIGAIATIFVVFAWIGFFATLSTESEDPIKFFSWYVLWLIITITILVLAVMWVVGR
jgi:hypothetical protein